MLRPTQTEITTDAGERVAARTPVIVSASRATDIPACYADWFFERLRRGYVARINPFDGRRSYISFARTRAVVFWSKNPRPLLPRLAELRERGIHCYVQYTLNDYEDEGLEPHLPPLEERIDTFLRLAEYLGRGLVVWRFDPLLLTDRLGTEELLRRAERIGDSLRGAAEKLVFSFADIGIYRHVVRNLDRRGIRWREFTDGEMLQTAAGLAALNERWGYTLAACGERVAPPFVQGGQSRGGLQHLPVGELPPADAAAVEVPDDMAVDADVRETEHEFFGRTPQAVADALRPAEQLFRSEAVGEQQRIEAPDDQPPAQILRQPEEGVDPLLQRREVRLQSFVFVVVEGVLHVTVNTPFPKLREAGQQGTGIFRPEDHGARPGEGDVGPTAVEGVDPRDVAPPQPLEKPVGVAGRNVRGTARRDDHRRPGRDPLARIGRNLGLRRPEHLLRRAGGYLQPPTGILAIRPSWRPPSNEAEKKASSICTASSLVIKRAGKTITLASLWRRISEATSASQHSPARMPRCLLSVMVIPSPEPQRAIPCSSSPASMASASGCA